MYSSIIKNLKQEEPLIKKISILIFIWIALLFFLNLQYDFLDIYDIILFWLPILIMLGVIVYQIFFIKSNTFVLFEILIIYFLLHLVFQVGYYGLRGGDSYIDYNLLKTILNEHNFVLGQGVDGWPMIHIFSSSFSLVTKVYPLLVAKFLPSFISSIIVLPIYLLIYSIYKDRKIALLSSLIFGTIPHFVSFEAAFVREIFAFFIMILFFYILYISKKRKDYYLTLLIFLLIPVIVFAHHFTSFMIIVLLGIYLTISKLILFIYRRDVTINKRLTGIINIKMVFLVALIAVIAYWVYHAVFVVEYSSDVLYEGLGFREVTSTYAQQLQLNTSIVTIQGKILYYGFFFFHFLFSLILLISLMRRKNNHIVEDTSFTIFFFFCMFYAFLALYIIGSLLFPERFLTFAWIFGIIPITSFILFSRKVIIKKALIVLLILFIIFNIYNIDPEIYTGKISNQDNITTEKDYIIAEQFNFPEKYFGYVGVFNAIYDVQGIDPRIGGKSLEKFNNSPDYSTMAVINDDIYLYDLQNYKEKSKEEYDIVIKILSYKNDKDIDKICDFGSLYILNGIK